MIKLDPNYCTTVISSFNGTTQTITTDTLFVSDVRLDMRTGAIYSTVQKGTGSPFVSNLSSIDICVNPDGSFISSDGLWSGSVQSAPALVAQLKATFDQFILASGKVTGTAV